MGVQKCRVNGQLSIKFALQFQQYVLHTLSFIDTPTAIMFIWVFKWNQYVNAHFLFIYHYNVFSNIFWQSCYLIMDLLGVNVSAIFIFYFLIWIFWLYLYDVDISVNNRHVTFEKFIFSMNENDFFQHMNTVKIIFIDHVSYEQITFNFRHSLKHDVIVVTFKRRMGCERAITLSVWWTTYRLTSDRQCKSSLSLIIVWPSDHVGNGPLK